MKKLEEYVVTIPDFPEPGIMFRDITSVIQDPDGLKLSIDGLVEKTRGLDFDLVIGPESRGFIFGVPVAYLTGKGFVPVRKKGKLPRKTISRKYDLEYGDRDSRGRGSARAEGHHCGRPDGHGRLRRGGSEAG